VEGTTFPVVYDDQGEALRVDEGDIYEVVTARFGLEGEETAQRTFRFAWFEDKLTE
jgi:hypothetical protein